MLLINDDNNNINSQVLDFIDKVSASELRDYHLSISDNKAIWSAARLDNNIDYPFNFDGGRSDRKRKWDRGALEYQSNKVVYAVGLSTADLQTLPSVEPLKYTVENVNGRSIITFTEPQVDPGLGIGNEVIDNSSIFSTGCLLIEKINTSKWVVADYYGSNIPDRIGTYEVSLISRVFANLTDALVLFKSAPYVGYDLETAGAHIVFACYDDDFIGPQFTQTAKLDGCGGGKNHNIKIMTPYNIETQCNTTQRHNGIYGDGYSFEPFVLSEEENAAIYVNQHSYFEIEGLQISSNLDDASGIHLYDCVNSYIGYNIIHDMDGHGIYHEPITNPVDEVINNLVYDCGFDGIFIKIQEWEFFSVRMLINNNTIFGCRRGVHVDKPDYHFPAGLSIEINNTISTDSEYRDFVSQYDNEFGRVSLNSCVSGDASSWLFPGLNNIQNKYISFISRTNKNFNLSKIKDGFAVDSAIDLSTAYIHPFVDDINNEARDPGEYDLGAFEVIDLIGSGEMAIGPIVTNSPISIESLIFPTTIIYLREPGPGSPGDPSYISNYLPHIDHQYQFTTIEGSEPLYNINAFLDEQPKTDHITIYVHGGKVFQGTFELQDRYPRNVTIMTYPNEAHIGPASHVYNGPIADDVSNVGLLLYQNMKVYSSDSGGQEELLNNTANIKALKFINSIVQVNYDTIIDSLAATVQVINSKIIYRYGAGILGGPAK